MGASRNNDSNSKELVVKSKESQDDLTWAEKIAIKESIKDAEFQRKLEDARVEEYKYRQEVREKQNVSRKYLTDSSNITFNPATGELSAPVNTLVSTPSNNTRLLTGSSNYGTDTDLGMSGYGNSGLGSSGFGTSSSSSTMKALTSGGGFDGRASNLPSYSAPPPMPSLSTKPGGSLNSNSNALVLGSSSLGSTGFSSNSFGGNTFGTTGYGGFDSTLNSSSTGMSNFGSTSTGATSSCRFYSHRNTMRLNSSG